MKRIVFLILLLSGCSGDEQESSQKPKPLAEKPPMIEGNVYELRPSSSDVVIHEHNVTVQVEDLDLSQLEDLLFKLENIDRLHSSELPAVKSTLEETLYNLGLEEEISEDKEASILILKSLVEQKRKASQTSVDMKNAKKDALGKLEKTSSP